MFLIRKLRTRFSWTREHNRQAKVECRLAEYLTRLLNERPEVSLRALLVSRKVQARIGEEMHDLMEVLGKEVTLGCESDRLPDGKRRVWVTIDPKR